MRLNWVYRGLTPGEGECRREGAEEDIIVLRDYKLGLMS